MCILFARRMLLRHATIVISIKTFRKPLKILHLALSLKAVPGYMKKKDRRLRKYCGYSPTHVIIEAV